ncbi:NPCBM/NEW2 domain-containing protein [Geothrix sp. PMB-07]|uniref:NPCBM/NEW2 domain-containing protein n=1 Tax=Geothrix sp. PMB-07 TaxID=3068640 RepID=UPI0027425E4B|nr:NPCBM/NEW2 domain-containing protein [Geothrix sp. PMB-07]WLT30957.1 NPCBM/NEW2 domain-containing protein [Geothrix sp. PMB-07]
MPRPSHPALLLALTCMLAAGQPKPGASAKAPTPAKGWPYPIPARVKDSANGDLFVMTLGEVKTSLAQGTYDPAKDELTLQDGRRLPHYYRDTLKLKFFKAMDKSIFPVAPSGFCTWYYYYQDLDEQEVRRNTDWIAQNLKDYGAQIIQIDDAWQAEKADGKHGSRDWSAVDRHFPSGMADLARYIKGKGFTPGLWIAPHGQSNDQVVQASPGVFLRKPDGTSPSDTWEGKWLVDPSTEASQTYLKGLFSRLAGWGYDYLKIDGQPIVVEEYGKTQAFMQKPGAPDQLYRHTLDAIRAGLGPNRYLLGCWGLPVEGMGLMNGSRTGGDVVLGWEGFLTALAPTLQSYYQHNIAWYTDPDVMLLRAPLTLDQARVWASLQGLTGQALFSSDRLPDLSQERVNILRKVFPATDIRPLDLFPATRNKRIWDLKVQHLGRGYDVVGAFNFRQDRPDQLYLGWKDLGLAADRPVHVFDFWNQEYLGAWDVGMALDLAPTSCRVLSLVPSDGQIQLVSTNRHLTQGWVDLQELRRTASGFSGKSKLIENDPYELHFAFPRGQNFEISQASAHSASGALPIQITQHQGWATLRITSKQTQEIRWKVAFKPTGYYHYPTQAPVGLQVEPMGLDGADLKWKDQYYLNAGYQVYLDGQLQGQTATPHFPLRGLDPTRSYTVEVRSVWEDGVESKGPKKAELAFTLGALLPEMAKLTELDPIRSEGRGAEPRTFTVTTRHRAGLSAHAGSEVEFDLKGLFTTFTGQAAFDDSDREKTPVTFTVLADGRELWTSGPLAKAAGPKPFSLDVRGVKHLVLRTSAQEAAPEDDDWLNAPHAAWLDPVLAKIAQ